MQNPDQFALMNVIWGTVRDYGTSAYTLAQACKAAINRLESEGHTARIIWYTGNRTFRYILVDELYLYRIESVPGWSTYEVRMVDYVPRAESC